ncbi:hypothetical protein H6F43_06990 [Leptolyngbya sp. FACHB-36]|uniref:hypothetical protein n=1 Tax=Leptolyngbya sp. FACHB-36 TaxID=2692808 RepID=UPI001680EBA2|nr:hypothetical protein [Leptolyngbya sp. FACHB-36]MBD2019932.1 hypothetical protein [Leptolyngbya sp. FACHB-36]
MLATDTIFINAPLYQMGFKDGTRSMMRGSMCDDMSYLAGFNAGIKLYRSSIPVIQEGYLERCDRDEVLNGL